MANYARGTTATFTHSFLDGVGSPIVPLNVNYPTVQVEDPTGTIIASGVGTATATPGEWTWSWAISSGATLGDGWVIQWDMVDVNSNTWEWREAFTIVDQIEEPTSLDRTGGYLTMKGADERLIWQNATDPDELQVTLRDPDETDVWTQTKSALTYVYADGYHSYYYETTASTDHADEGQYLVIWRYRVSAASQYLYQTQWMAIPYNVFWVLLPHFKLLVDKLNKVTTTPLSYLDIELWQSMQNGIDLINSVFPYTTWTTSDCPSQFYTFWILAAGIYVLNARQLLEIEVQHDLSGNTTTLNYDHVGPLSEVLQRWENYLWEKLPPAKLAAYRQSAGPGVVAVRPYRLNYTNRVYRVGTSANAIGSFPSILNAIGLY